jgi:hypothetical protein
MLMKLLSKVRLVTCDAIANKGIEILVRECL